MEAYEKLLETWMQLVPDMKQMPAGALKPHATEVFNSYVQCHISAPDGIKTSVSGLGNDETENKKYTEQH